MNLKPNVIISILILLTMALSAEARGENNQPEKTSEEIQEEENIQSGILPGALSIFPGIIVHGSGHYAAGDRETAKDLLILEGISLASFMIPAYSLLETGASRKVTPAAVPVMTASAGAFLLSWFADVYGSFSGDGRTGGYRRTGKPAVNFGVTYINDPQFEYSSFATTSFDYYHRAWHVSPMAWISLDDDNKRFIMELEYELVGDDGRFLKDYNRKFSMRVTNRYGYHKFDTEKFDKRWIDLCITGRIEMGEIWKSLHGSFADFETGYNAEWVTFLIDEDIPAEYTDQHLFLSGFGVYLGDAGRSLGEIRVYYNHRRDDFTGGLPYGFAGYAGLDAEFFIMSGLKASIEIVYGYAFIAGIQIGYLF